jgi:hypothetical protein
MIVNVCDLLDMHFCNIIKTRFILLFTGVCVVLQGSMPLSLFEYVIVAMGEA